MIVMIGEMGLGCRKGLGYLGRVDMGFLVRRSGKVELVVYEGFDFRGGRRGCFFLGERVSSGGLFDWRVLRCFVSRCLGGRFGLKI